MSELDPRLKAALTQVEANPESASAWDDLEEIAASLQRPDEVGQLYRDILARPLSADAAGKLGPRAVGFHEEWYGEDSPHLADVLTRVLTLDPKADWALSRVTVLMTVRERWSDLLSLYDRALAAADDPYRKTQLLEEAMQLAKDFAGQPDRAIGYLATLSELRPNDAQVANQLERLLERQGRHEELIALWRRGSDAASESTRLTIASTYLDALGNPGMALEEARSLLDEGLATDAAIALVERVMALETAPADVRRGALTELRSRYASASRAADVERVTRAALTFSTGAEKVALHRELADRSETAGDAHAAIEQWSALLALDPSDGEAEERLAKVADGIGAHAELAAALEAASSAATSSSRRNELLIAAADVRGRIDRGAAEALYRRVLDGEATSAARRLEVARRLATLLDAAGSERARDRLALREQLASLETDSSERRRALGSAARLAAELGESERALAAWDTRLALDAADLEALEAKSEILRATGKHDERVRTLAQRAALPLAPAVRRADLLEIARIQETEIGDAAAAIETWHGIAAEYGENNETVDALSRLFEAEERHEERNVLLERGSKRDAERAVETLVRLAALRAGPMADVSSAARLYHEAIRLDPAHPSARAGLSTLLAIPEAKGGAVEGLAEAARRTDDVPALLALLADRLDAADGPRARVRLLREAASLEEERRSDTGRAFERIREAFVASPDDDAIERELLRLAGLTDRKNEAAVALAEASLTLDADPLRAFGLARRAADLFEEGGLAKEALDAARAAFAIEPGNVAVAEQVVRLGAQTDDFALVAATLVDNSFALRAIEEQLLELVETAGESKTAWDQLASAAESLVEARVSALSATESRAHAELLRSFFVRFAAWHRDHRGDLEQAEALLARALAFDPAHTDTLRELARLSWRAPGQRLVDTLLALADQLPGDLDALFDAARIAEENVKDPVLTREILGRLQRAATRLWLKGEPARGERPADRTALDALTSLVRLETDAGRIAHAIDWLVEGSRLPVPPAESRAMLRRAGDLAREKLGDETRAMRLYQQVIEDTLEDSEVVDRLAKTFEARGRVPELLALRKRELELDLAPDRKLVVRLEVARLLGHLEDKGGRVEMLRANLADQPGHVDSIAEVSLVLEGKGRSVELADLLAAQAKKLEEQDPSRAAGLWSKVARIGEDQLRDADRALLAYRRVVTLAPTTESLEALSRIHLGRSEPALAAEWLEKQLEMTKGEGRTGVALRLAEARLSAGRVDRAILALERALAEDTSASAARDRLAELYRTSNKPLELANLLRDGSKHVTGETQLAYVREAASLYKNVLGTPEEAISILEAARETGALDLELKSTLAEGYRTSKRLDEARALLEQMVTDFGRRRSPERASAHYQLAQVAHAAGDIKEALDHLDKASGMDLAHPGILRLLGQLAREGGQLDRSERAYRALLLLVRRQSPDSPDVQVGASEVLYELSRLAKDRNQEAQARELLESAIETAHQSSAEAARFTKVLIARKEPELADKLLARRMQLDPEGLPRARALADRADVLELLQDKPAEALDARLAAIDIAPEWSAQISAARALAKRLDVSARLATSLRGLVDRATRRKEDAPLASELLMQLGDILENDVKDLEGAAESYGRVETLGVRTVDAWRALGRVAALRGDRIEEIRVLRRLVAAGVDTSALGRPEDDIPESAKTDALYRIAEVELRSEETLESGLDTLVDAVARDSDHPRTARTTATAAAAFPDHEGLRALWERAARGSGDPALLLPYLTHRVARDSATLEEVREAVEVATQLGQPEGAERLLVRGAEIATGSIDGLSGSLWIPTALAERRRAAGDVPGAIRWTQAAVDAADAAGDAAKTDGLLKDLAALAGSPGGDPQLAASTYARLVETEPKDQSLWGPAADAYAAIGDREGYEALVRRTLDGLIEPGDRNQLRMELASRLMGGYAAQEDAIGVLREVLEEEPDHLGASQLLADVFEKAGREEELADLLRLQLDRARDRSDATAVAALSLRTGGLLARTRREDAMDAYRAGLDWAAEDAGLLRALYGLYGKDDDARDRATIGERLLAVEEGKAAAKLALSIADQFTALDDHDAALRALDTGFRAAPQHEKLRTRLETALREKNDLDALADLIVFDAAHREDRAGALARFREAATLYRTQLDRPERAAEVLKDALTHAQGDLELLAELIDALTASGRIDDASEAVREALEAQPDPTKERAHLLRARSKLQLALNSSGTALGDAEEAFRIDARASRDDLVAALDAHRETLASGGDLEAERVTTLRLSSVLRATNDAARSRDVLAAWADRDPSDVSALRTLVEMDTQTSRWSDVVLHATRLVSLETGDAQAEIAVRLHEAADKAGAPESARAGLEQAHADQPENAAIRGALRSLYESVEAFEELTQILLLDAQHGAADVRFESLRKAGEIFVYNLGHAARAIAPLREALAIKEDDLDLLVLLVDALIGSDALAEAVEILQSAINTKGRRRSPQLAALQQRMARIAGLSGDAQTQLEWLKVAMETDKTSNSVAAELADLAMSLGDDASAMTALKVVTLQKTPGPMSKAIAFLRQAQIASRQGDHQKAVLWARRARIEDAELREAEEFLNSIGEA